MDAIKPLVCKCCGGHIDPRTMKCPYCDTQYDGKLEPLPQTHTYAPDGIETLVVSVQIDGDVFRRKGDEFAKRVVEEQLSKAIAKGILPYLEIKEHKSHMSFSRVFTAQIKLFRK